MKKITFLSFFVFIIFLVPFSNVLALNARIETVDGEVLTIKDFSMEGKQHFYIDWKGGTSTLDWNEIASFEIMGIGQPYWVEVLLLNGKKDSFRVRQFSSFKGKSDFGQWSIPFEKMKKVSFLRDTIEEKRKEEISIKEPYALPSSTPKEVDKIILRNGDVLIGNLLNQILSIKTNYGTISFKKVDIHHVTFGISGRVQKERELDTIYSKYGDKLTGVLSESQIKITLFTKVNLTIFKEHIKEIEFGVMADTEQKLLQEKLTEFAPSKPND